MLSFTARVQQSFSTNPAAHLLNVRLANGQPLSEIQLIAEVGIIMSAGFETTSNTATWALSLLALHPGRQRT
jgi:cytochrome P450